jgi:FkbM family methyltransferase
MSGYLKNLLERVKVNHGICNKTATPFGWFNAYYLSRLKLRISLLPITHVRVHSYVRNSPVYLRARLNTADARILRGIFYYNEYEAEIIPRNLKRVIDLGANCGYCLAYLSKVYPEAEFVAVEPDPGNLVELSYTIQINKIPAQIISAGIGDQMGFFYLKLDESNPSRNQIIEENNTSFSVSVITLEEILRIKNWDYVDLIKMDIEGMEAKILNEKNTVLKKAKYILFELHPWVDHDAVFRSLTILGFNVSACSKSGNQTFIAVNDLIHKQQ